MSNEKKKFMNSSIYPVNTSSIFKKEKKWYRSTQKNNKWESKFW